MAALRMIRAQSRAPRPLEAGASRWIRAPQSGVIYREVDSIDPLALKRAILKALNARKPW